MEKQHDAFISYNHLADGKLAKALEEGLEKLAKPLLSLRAIDIFRDETGLAANPKLWGGIVDHLSHAGWLVVLACPEWSRSVWCGRELQWWLENRAVDRILIVVTGGDVAWDSAGNDFAWTATTALGEGLRGRFREEPLYVDMRWARGEDGLTLRNLRFREAVLDLAAAIRGVRKDELDGADVRQLRRNRRLVQVGVAAIAIAAVVAVWQAIVATEQRDEAIRQARFALSRGFAAVAHEKLAADDEQLDVALLAATQAMKLDPGPVAKASLTAALQSHYGLQRLIWTGARPYAVEFSPDGNRLASAGEDGSWSLWDAATGKLLRQVADAHRHEIWALAFLPDGKRVVTASLDATAAIWDVDSGAFVGQRMSGHADQILAVAVSRDGRLAATACLDGSVWLWDLDRQQVVRKLDGAHDGGARAVAFGADGSTLASGGFDGTVDIWSVATGELLAGPGRAHGGGVLRLVFSPDGTVLASAGMDGAVQRWDTRTWRPVFSEPFVRHDGDVLGLAFSRSGRELASGGSDGGIVMWEPGMTHDETATWAFPYHKNQVWQVAFNPDATLLAAASWDGSISIWHTRGSVGFRTDLTDYPDGIHGLAYQPGTGVLALGAPDGRVFLRTPGDAAARNATLTDQKSEVLVLEFSVSGALLASGAVDGSVALWEMGAEPRLRWKSDGNAPVFDLAFAPDEAVLVSSGGDGSLTRWDVAAGRALAAPVQAHSNGAGSAFVAFHPGGKYFASAGRGGGVFLWDAADGRKIATPREADYEFSGFEGIAFSPNGGRLVASTGGGPLYVWNDGAWGAPSVQWVGTGTGPIAFGTDSSTLAVGGAQVTIWDLESQQVVAGPFKGRGQVWGVGLSADGQRLAASFPHEPATVWTLNPRDWMEEACTIANRELRPDEWREIAGPFPYEETCADVRKPAAAP